MRKVVTEVLMILITIAHYLQSQTRVMVVMLVGANKQVQTVRLEL